MERLRLTKADASTRMVSCHISPTDPSELSRMATQRLRAALTLLHITNRIARLIESVAFSLSASHPKIDVMFSLCVSYDGHILKRNLYISYKPRDVQAFSP